MLTIFFPVYASGRPNNNGEVYWRKRSNAHAGSITIIIMLQFIAYFPPEHWRIFFSKAIKALCVYTQEFPLPVLKKAMMTICFYFPVLLCEYMHKCPTCSTFSLSSFLLYILFCSLSSIISKERKNLPKINQNIIPLTSCLSLHFKRCPRWFFTWLLLTC